MESLNNVEMNTRSSIILALLEDHDLHERPDLAEYLQLLTDVFYLSRDKYIEFGDDEMAAKERAMDDVKSYILSDNEE